MLIISLQYIYSLAESDELKLTPSGAIAELLKVFGSNLPPSEYKSNVE